LNARRFATIDPDHFVDYQSSRPLIKLDGADKRELVWPEFELYEARAPRASRDLILLSGPEPAMRWREFTENVIELADVLGVETMISLGSLLADVPHTRPVELTGLASEHELLEKMGIDVPDYEGPTGIVGVLYSAFSDAGFATASLWAAVPHYVAVSPNPKGALALLRKLETLIEISVDATELEQAALTYEQQVSSAVDLDPDVRAFVERLERSTDESHQEFESDIPSGEIIARDFQRFLRQQGPE
jgi:predicted ATP-grasp superfamily ATP-dependent carboligase